LFAVRIAKATRAIAKNVLGPRLASIIRKPFSPKLRSIADYRSALQSKCGLEIGGPSPLLASDGSVPIYDVLRSLDNCLYAGSTIWTGDVQKGNTFHYQSGKEPGTQLICDATDLKAIGDSSYECVLGCHCLEHIANPLRALAEWKRVLKNDGLLLLILPHKDGTFDWRRKTTSLPHMIEDYEKGVGEEDLTHLTEILDLHDLSKDEAAGTKEQFYQRCLANHTNRAMHHHVFDTMGALRLISQAGFQIRRVNNLRPYHIIVLATRTDLPFDNRRFMELGCEHWSQSPFSSDRKYARI
jgi:hypothetical protein